MTDHHQVYDQYSRRYEALVAREDARGLILPALNRISPLENMDVVELGAGTGRLTCLIAPYVRSIQAFDASQSMLDVAVDKLTHSNVTAQWSASVGDHRALPIPDACADLAISGWSICYLVAWGSATWQAEVEKALAEMKRVLRPGGKIIILETLGTGFETPHPPEHLVDYYKFLETSGFSHTWIRTDYAFQSIEEAVDLVQFFFGAELAAQVNQAGTLNLPECTGIWWKPNENSL